MGYSAEEPLALCLSSGWSFCVVEERKMRNKTGDGESSPVPTGMRTIPGDSSAARCLVARACEKVLPGRAPFTRAFPYTPAELESIDPRDRFAILCIIHYSGRCLSWRFDRNYLRSFRGEKSPILERLTLCAQENQFFLSSNKCRLNEAKFCRKRPVSSRVIVGTIESWLNCEPFEYLIRLM